MASALLAARTQGVLHQTSARVGMIPAAQSRGMFGGGTPGRMPGFWMQPPAIVPKFWTGKDAVPRDRFTIDCSPYRPEETPCPELKDRMQKTFKEQGACLLKNTRLKDPVHMSNYAQAMINNGMKTYQGGANPREGIIDNVFEVGAPGDAWLHYHHEMAYNKHSMKNLAFCSLKAPFMKGDTYLSENLQVTEELLATDFGRKLKEHGVTYIRCLTDKEAYEGQGWMDGRAVYNHWQTSFGVKTLAEAEEAAAQCGLKVEWVTDPLMESSKRYMKTSLTISAFEYCPSVGRNVLYSSIADHNMWFDTWQGVAEVDPEKRPLQMTFGDGSPISIEELRQWVGAYDRGGVRVQWEQGDIVAFCNYRYAHGRPAYHLNPWEVRQIGVVLGEKFHRIGAAEHAW
jgi:hypothetical protein